MSVLKLARILCLVTGSVCATLSAAWADMLVLESTTSQYAVGDHVDDVAVKAFPAGQHVRVLLLPSDVTKLFEGEGPSAAGDLPYGGTRGLKRKPQ
jgi:hypothetical protein